MRRVIWSGCPTVAIVCVDGEVGAREAVCRMWICGMETVMMM